MTPELLSHVMNKAAVHAYLLSPVTSATAVSLNIGMWAQGVVVNRANVSQLVHWTMSVMYGLASAPVNQV